MGLVSNREEELFQQALMNSRMEKQLPKHSIEEAPTFRPSEEEFNGNPLDYIESIRKQAEPYGICLIVPPESFKPVCTMSMDSTVEFSTKLQRIDRLQESLPYGDGQKYTPAAYKKMADEFAANWSSVENLEEEYWNLVDSCAKPVKVEYGNDVDGSALEHDSWSLTEIPRRSLLHHFKIPLPGINTPWLYFGMLFSTFSWHNEDNYLASINYHHFGSAKQWYGVPGSHAAAFENVVRRFFKQRLLEVPDLLHHMNTMFSPSKLKALDVPVYKLKQTPGTFVVTFPQAFHSGFSYGFNLGEAVNIAPACWIKHARIASERYRRVGRLAVVSHDRLVFTLVQAIQDFSQDYDECILLRDELSRICKEEAVLRPRLYTAGIRDVSSVVSVPRNSVEAIDDAASDYDDKRVCVVCRHTCFSSAVACNCSQTKVVCLRHWNYICKCPHHNKYLIEWESLDDLKETQNKVEIAIKKKFPKHEILSF